MTTMLQTTGRSTPLRRANEAQPLMGTWKDTEAETATVASSMDAPSLESPRLAEMMNREEEAELEQREQEALALLGRLAAFD